MDDQEDEFVIAPGHPIIPRRLAILVGIAAAVVLGLWLFGTPDGILGKAEAIGYAICHRIAARSFLINGMPMPLCARCTGIYLGVLSGLMLAFASGRGKATRLPPTRVIIALAAFVAVMGFDGVNSYIHLFPGGTGLYEPQNWLRLVTGMYCGIAMIELVLPVFNNSVWRSPERQRSVNNLRELAGICAVGAVVVLMVLTQDPILLTILGVLSTLGVLIMLSLIGTVLFLSIIRRDRTVVSSWQLAIPVLAGLTIAFIELGGMDIIRYALMGTWNGFPLGG